MQLLPIKHSSNHSIRAVFDDECAEWRSGSSLPGTLIRNMTETCLCAASCLTDRTDPAIEVWLRFLQFVLTGNEIFYLGY